VILGHGDDQIRAFKGAFRQGRGKMHSILNAETLLQNDLGVLGQFLSRNGTDPCRFDLKGKALRQKDRFGNGCSHGTAAGISRANEQYFQIVYLRTGKALRTPVFGYGLLLLAVSLTVSAIIT